ncbi:hypothetical protein E8E15_010639 [Penicillium rubens]|uniref:Uncharacterized protein n=1 Tax=Penicillium chrysogenum TaxID=5076 RepID=A0A167XNK5_PENCH|nr:hypothetical protein E8E15_010639 [Penicillium rubens]KAJ5045771.1 hypothetical protein NUH16_002591 [Penicillium rubens]KZN93030.1 hypothetical protein EN45_031980 [Penicillium chrysogenum]
MSLQSLIAADTEAAIELRDSEPAARGRPHGRRPHAEILARYTIDAYAKLTQENKKWTMLGIDSRPTWDIDHVTTQTPRWD